VFINVKANFLYEIAKKTLLIKQISYVSDNKTLHSGLELSPSYFLHKSTNAGKFYT
jgi:hypothetical protein